MKTRFITKQHNNPSKLAEHANLAMPTQVKRAKAEMSAVPSRVKGIIYSPQAGFTLIEVLIAAVILGLVAMPVTTGLLNAVKSLNYSRDAYKASLYADSLLTCLENNLRQDKFTGFPENMAWEYETDIFDYTVKLNDLKTNNTVVYKTNDMLTPKLEALCVNKTIDGMFVTDALDVFNLTEFQLNLASGSAVMPVINVAVENGTDLLSVVNQSRTNTLVRCFGVPAEIELFSEGAITVLGMNEEQKHGAYMLVAEVWSKNGGRLAYGFRLVLI